MEIYLNPSHAVCISLPFLELQIKMIRLITVYNSIYITVYFVLVVKLSLIL